MGKSSGKGKVVALDAGKGDSTKVTLEDSDGNAVLETDAGTIAKTARSLDTQSKEFKEVYAAWLCIQEQRDELSAQEKDLIDPLKSRDVNTTLLKQVFREKRKHDENYEKWADEQAQLDMFRDQLGFGG